MKKLFATFDDNGSIIRQTLYEGSALMEGWFIMYKEPLKELIMKCKEYSKVRVFIYLSTLQTYDTYIFTTIRAVSKALNITYKTCWDCFKWLEKENYIKKFDKEGVTAYVINPKITTCGKKSLPHKNQIWNLNLDELPKIEAIDSSPSTETSLNKTIDTETGEILTFTEEDLKNEH